MQKILSILLVCGFALGLILLSTGRIIEGRAAVIIAMCIASLLIQTTDKFKNLAFTAWVLTFIGAALSFPSLFRSWGDFEPKSLIVPLIQITLFGMGMTLRTVDFLRVFEMPKAVLAGIILQYSVMPLAAWMFARLFQLSPEIAVGLILVGSCPGGVASNVISYLAGVNVPLSVTMTACSTLLSPLTTPLLMKYLAGKYVVIEVIPMMVSILYMIIIPLVLGIVINRYLHRFSRRIVRLLPFIAMMSICMIIGITIALSRDDFLLAGLSLFGASACHNAMGYISGYWLQRAQERQRRACFGRIRPLERRDEFLSRLVLAPKSRSAIDGVH